MRPMKDQLEILFRDYIAAFAQLDIDKVSQCYLMPCMLSTPDKVVLLNSNETFVKEFSQIFNLLKQEEISTFVARAASYDQISESTAVVCIEWQFMTEPNNLFTEFTAIYHLTKSGDKFKIISVVSQDISQSISLSQPLHLNQE